MRGATGAGVSPLCPSSAPSHLRSGGGYLRDLRSRSRCRLSRRRACRSLCSRRCAGIAEPTTDRRCHRQALAAACAAAHAKARKSERTPRIEHPPGWPHRHHRAGRRRTPGAWPAPAAARLSGNFFRANRVPSPAAGPSPGPRHRQRPLPLALLALQPRRPHPVEPRGLGHRLRVHPAASAARSHRRRAGCCCKRAGAEPGAGAAAAGAAMARQHLRL